MFRMMPVATGSIEALRLLPPSGVQYDEDGLPVRYTGPENSQCRFLRPQREEFSLTVEGLPLARGSPTVTSSQAGSTAM